MFGGDYGIALRMASKMSLSPVTGFAVPPKNAVRCVPWAVYSTASQSRRVPMIVAPRIASISIVS